MPNKMPSNLAEIMVHSEVHLSCYRQQSFLQKWNLSGVDDNRKLGPIQHIGKWKVIIVGENYRNASIMYGITNPCRVHFVTFNMKTIFAPPEAFLIRIRTLVKNIH